jgi:hypothetical protein
VPLLGVAPRALAEVDRPARRRLQHGVPCGNVLPRAATRFTVQQHAAASSR